MNFQILKHYLIVFLHNINILYYDYRPGTFLSFTSVYNSYNIIDECYKSYDYSRSKLITCGSARRRDWGVENGRGDKRRRDRRHSLNELQRAITQRSILIDILLRIGTRYCCDEPSDDWKLDKN